MSIQAVILTVSLAAFSSGAFVQHVHDTSSARSPYAEEQKRDIKSLSAAEEQALLDGAGMGYAKSAELNGYPGPMHVLELADALALSAQQRERTEALMLAHKARARELGSRLVKAERDLDAAFAERRIDDPSLRSLTATIASLQADLRAEHLATHLAQTAQMTPMQVEAYARLRGYSTSARTGSKHHTH